MEWAGVPMASIGAAFWGLVFGFAISLLLERADFREEQHAREEKAAREEQAAPEGRVAREEQAPRGRG